MYEKLRAAAERNWSTWASGLADGGAPPPPLELLEAAALLGIHEPAAALEGDAAAIRRVADLEAHAAGLREQAAAQRAPHGSQDERRERIAALKAEIRKLEALSGVHPFQLRAGEILGAAGRIRRKHPRAFRAPAPVVAKKTPSRKKEMAQ